ncbi:MAG: hypothetical protein JST27_08890, partial [Bacteroidetes bacterium]|nr:hypothetical protein [Bacteroidota bacterium]
MIQKIITLVLLALCAQGGFAQAQSWQWGRSISFDSGKVGSPYFSFRYTGSGGTFEGTTESTTDQAGNVYLLLMVNGSHLNVAGHIDTGYSKNDILLCSFNCDGVFRWSKLIGVSSDSNAALSIKASVESGVFVAGMMNMSSTGGGHFGKDTTVANTTKTMFLAKWDTAGNFQWVRLPQPDTISLYSAWTLCQPADMDLSNDGTIYLLAQLIPGAYAGSSYVVNTNSTQVLKYSSSGQFLGGIVLPINNLTSSPFPFNYNIYGSRLRYDNTNNRLIITGNYVGYASPVNIGGTLINGIVALVGSFNATTGTLNWLKVSNPARQHPNLTSVVFLSSSPKIDASGNVFVVGASMDSGIFNGNLFTATTKRNTSQFVMKLEANSGKNLWTTIGQCPTNESFFNDIALTGQKLAITGYYQDSLIFPNALLTNNPSDTGDAFIVQLDAATGNVQKMASLSGSSLSRGNLIAADRRGNFYIAGNYALQGQAIGPDALTLNNYNNLFVAKWGW